MDFSQITTPTQLNLLVSFFDLSGMVKLMRSKRDIESFTFFAELFELIGTIIEKTEGKVVKFIGDSGLIIYPENKINEGVQALLQLKKEAEQWLNEQGYNNKIIIKAHYGAVVCGVLGTPSDKRFDIMGLTVNTTATLPSHGIAITPQLFRQLNDNMRKLFKKHTPPIRYILAQEAHRD